MDYTTWNLPTQPTILEIETMPLLSLYEALQGLTDTRRAQGRRYSLALIVCLVIVAKLAGQQSLSGTTQWIRHRGSALAKRFGLSRERMPCQMTYCKVLAKIDGKQLDELLSAFLQRWEAQSRCGQEPSRLQTPQGHADHRQLAIDGKTLRATRKEEQPVHQLSCYEVATSIVLWHCNVGTKENEISALKPFFTTRYIQGRIWTLDAMHTQRELCSQLHRLGGKYLLIAKDNQPTLRADIADLLEDRQPDRRRWKIAQTWDKGHGRLEHRHITCSPDRNRVVWQPVGRHRASVSARTHSAPAHDRQSATRSGLWLEQSLHARSSSTAGARTESGALGHRKSLALSSRRELGRGWVSNTPGTCSQLARSTQ